MINFIEDDELTKWVSRSIEVLAEPTYHFMVGYFQDNIVVKNINPELEKHGSKISDIVVNTYLGNKDNGLQAVFSVNPDKIDKIKNFFTTNIGNEDAFQNLKQYLQSYSKEGIGRTKTPDECDKDKAELTDLISKLPDHIKKIIANSPHLSFTVKNEPCAEGSYFCYCDQNQSGKAINPGTLQSFLKDGNDSTFINGEWKSTQKWIRSTNINLNNVKDISTFCHELGHYLSHLTETVNTNFYSSEDNMFWKGVIKDFINKNPEHEFAEHLKSYKPSQYAEEMSAKMFEKYLPKIIEGKTEEQAKKEMRSEYGNLMYFFEKLFLNQLQKITPENIQEYEGNKTPDKRLEMLERSNASLYSKEKY